jgi:hypothetical protein
MTILRRVATWGSVLLAGLNRSTALGLVLVVVVLVVGLGWVIKDPHRTQRLATIIRAWRGTTRHRN